MHQKKIFQYLIMHMSALDMLCFLQTFFNFIKRINTDFSNLRQIIGVKRSREPSISVPAPRSHNRIHRPHPP